MSPVSFPSDKKENELGSAENLPFLPLRIKQLKFIQLTLFFRGPSPLDQIICTLYITKQ